jgi:hypothetical protein
MDETMEMTEEGGPIPVVTLMVVVEEEVEMMN